jgi:HEPN domain-containing protein
MNVMDVNEHIQYWKNSSQEDLDAAGSLLEKGHLRHCMFFAHLVLEKALKAHVTKQTRQVPPRIHNLIRLAEMAEIPLKGEQADFLREFGVYQLEGRYPDSEQIALNESLVRSELDKVREMFEWLIRQL